MITTRVVEDATAWHLKHNKPVMMLEYGADTIEGFHSVSKLILNKSKRI